MTHMSGERGHADLRAAWTEMIDALNRARDAVDSAELHAPPVTAQGLADGYRYLLGFVFSGIERAFFEDPEYPYFRRAIQPVDKATIDNADALYLSASIDGAKSYRVRGRLVDEGAAKAPQYMIFEAHSVYAGDTGGLAELGPGGRVVTGLLDTPDLAVDDDGRFEILLAPQRPADYSGKLHRYHEGRGSRRDPDGVFPDRPHALSRLGTRSVARPAHRADRQRGRPSGAARSGYRGREHASRRHDRREPDEVLERVL